jgi:hypothetical protein
MPREISQLLNASTLMKCLEQSHSERQEVEWRHFLSNPVLPCCRMTTVGPLPELR